MKSSTPGEDLAEDPREFSLALGGPLFQLLRRAHLTDDALQLLRRRVLAISLFCWLPLLVLSALEGHLLGQSVAIPFLKDVDLHVRLLVALPLLIIAERVVHQRIRPLVKQFQAQDLVPESARPSFQAAVSSAARLRNSAVAEVLLIAFVYGVGVLVIWRHFMSIDTMTWYATPSAEGSKLTLTGWWYGLVSLPVFQFLLVRWLFRLFVWARFLFQVSRFDLNLIPTHPDRAGGLGFLSKSLLAYYPLAAAFGTLMAGSMANRIFYSGATLPGFKMQIAAGVVLVVVFFAGPLFVFVPRLSRAKRTGMSEFGILAQRYVREFDAKWLRGGAPADEAFVGSADIQSLADLGNSFEVVKSMRAVPVVMQDLIRIGVATLVPIGPLLLTVMPMEELLKMLLGLIL
jgi:hypothetical protein